MTEDLNQQSRRKYQQVKRKNPTNRIPSSDGLQGPPTNTLATRDEPAVIDDEWRVPTLNDSNFHYCK